jgi:hypothetical protein
LETIPPYKGVGCAAKLGRGISPGINPANYFILPTGVKKYCPGN